MKKILLLIPIILFFASTSFAQPADQYSRYLGKEYYLKRNLIFLLHNPKVSSNEILFADNCDQKRPGYSQILLRGEEVVITAVEKSDSYLRVSFTAHEDNFKLLFDNRSTRKFRKAFDLVFTSDENYKPDDKGCNGNYKTKKQVVKCLGFPIFSCKKGRNETLFYTLEYAGGHFGYDEWWIDFKDGKVINIQGTI